MTLIQAAVKESLVDVNIKVKKEEIATTESDVFQRWMAAKRGEVTKLDSSFHQFPDLPATMIFSGDKIISDQSMCFQNSVQENASWNPTFS